MGYIPMPAMDQGTLIGGSRQVVNYMNCTCYGYGCDPEIVRARFKEGFRVMPKFRYKVVEVAGDYYYEMMSIEETFKKGFIIGKPTNLKN